MLPTINLRCSCGKRRLDLRQGDPLFAEGFVDGDEQERLVEGFTFDSLCDSCGAVEGDDFRFDAPQRAVSAWSRYQDSMRQRGFAMDRRCGQCGRGSLIHAIKVSQITDIQREPSIGPNRDHEDLWWEVFHRLNEYYEELDYRYPRYGKPADSAGAGLMDGFLFVGEIALRTTLGISPGTRRLEQWSNHNARMRRRLHRDFFNTLPREFRSDFKLKQHYLMTVEDKQQQEQLLHAIRERIDRLAKDRDGVIAETQDGASLPCTQCQEGYLIQTHVRLGRLN